MIIYPLSLPTVKGFKTLTMRKRNVVGITESPHSLSQQVQDFGGQCWEAEFTLPKMYRQDGEQWQAFLDSLNGPVGTFLAGRPYAQQARGAISTTPLAIEVDGPAQSGQTMLIRSDTLTNVPGLLLRGDLFQLGTGLNAHLYSILQDVDMTGGGATLTFWPALRSTPADGAAIIVSQPVGLWRLVNPAPGFDEDEAGIMSIDPVPIREAL